MNIFKRLFKKKKPNTDPVIVAIEVVNIIKQAVESKTTLWFVNITKPNWDNRLVAAVREACVIALYNLNLVKEMKGPKLVVQNEALQDSMSFLRCIHKTDRGPIYDRLAGHIAAELSGELFESAVTKTRETYKQMV
jgi:hypothetical protein